MRVVQSELRTKSTRNLQMHTGAVMGRQRTSTVRPCQWHVVSCRSISRTDAMMKAADFNTEFARRPWPMGDSAAYISGRKQVLRILACDRFKRYQC